MHVPINVKSLNNISKWQMEFNSAFKGLIWMLCSSCATSCEFFVVYVFGRFVTVWSFLLSSLAILYDEDGILSITGRV
jgi:uncharacterized membrane protein YjjP (DUF1212 family)